MSDDIDFTGIEPATLVHALYHGTQPLGMGILHNLPGLTVEQVRTELAEYQAKVGNDNLYFDYYHGRPLKVSLNLKTSTFNPRLYDRDAGDGAAARIVAELKGA